MIHVEGKLGNEFVRSSTRTRTWSRAARLVEDAEAAGFWTDTQDEDQRSTDAAANGKLITEAIADFLFECRDEKGRDLADSTLSKYVTLLRRLERFSEQRGFARLDELDFAELTAFKRTWPTSALATGKTCPPQ
jgi:hypothetical protein